MLVVLSGPIIAGLLLNQPKLSTIPTISALFVGLVRINGTHRQQVTATGVATVGVTLALLIANLVSGSFWLRDRGYFHRHFSLGASRLSWHDDG